MPFRKPFLDGKEVDGDPAPWVQPVARTSDTFFREDEVVQAQRRKRRKCCMAIQRCKNDQIVFLFRPLEKRPRIIHEQAHLF
jgi:hypothetical protein